MRLSLKRITYENFKGIRNFTLRLDGQDASVYADNGVGKTTLMDGWLWLLFGKDSLNQANFEIKTLDESGQPIHNLDHSVEAVLELDGRELTLKKTYHEVWRKRRGSATKEFSGHETLHFVDGVPCTKTEFEARVSEIIDEDTFKLLSNPRHFNENLHWQDRRALLLEVCGDVTDEEVIASDQDLADLPKILNGRSLEDHRKVVAARRAEINKELDRIPVRIDEAQRGLPDVEGKDREALRAERDRLQEERKAKEQERARIEAGGEIAEQQRRLAEIETALQDVARRARGAIDQRLQGLREERNGVLAERDARRREIADLKHKVTQAGEEAHTLKVARESLLAQWHEINDQPFTHEQDDTCPTCGQAIPAEQLEAARAKALAAFNEQKAKRLADISAEGKRTVRGMEEAEQRREKAEAELAEVQRQHDALDAKADELREEIEALQASTPDATQDPEYQRLTAEKAEVEAAIAQLKEGNAEALKALNGALKALDDRIYFVGVELGRFEQREKGEQRIAELEAEEKRLAEEFERLEHELHLTDLFVQAKVRLLTDRINSRFELARFQLFRVLVNGGVEECCETAYQGVPYQSLNHGARLNVGLDIINTLAEHYEFAPPVWVDNAESVTSILPTRGQQIRLVVSAKDKALRVEQSAALVKEAV